MKVVSSYAVELIQFNHIADDTVSVYFDSVNRLDYILDGQRQMTLCHFPMMSWPHSTRAYMVFGHIHNNTNAEYWPLICRSELMLNAGVDINGFMPVTFDEMVANNRKHKEMSMTFNQQQAEEEVRA